MKEEKLKLPRHPAKYTDSLLPIFIEILDRHHRGAGRFSLLDPFGGTGKIFKLKDRFPDAVIEAVEIEPEWAAYDERTTIGDALYLPWRNMSFDAVCTSPVYGNRMSDDFVDHQPSKAYRRNTYTHAIGRKLSCGNAGKLQWGEEYREFHQKAWMEVRRVLKEGGIFILNIKDHIRTGRIMTVSQWHADTIRSLGFVQQECIKVNVPSLKHGQNGKARIDHENVFVFKKN